MAGRQTISLAASMLPAGVPRRKPAVGATSRWSVLLHAGSLCR